MATTPSTQSALAQQARRAYVEGVLRGLPGLVQSVENGARGLTGQSAEPSLAMKRRDLVLDLQKAAPFWQQGMTSMMRGALTSGMVSASRPGDLPSASNRNAGLSLVDDDTIEHEILSSRLALAIMDRASWEFSDLRSRINQLERRDELDPNDAFRPHVLARIATASWRAAGLSLEAWRLLQAVLHEEFAQFVEEGYHEINAWLLQRRVMPEVDLRPYIKRSVNSAWVGSLASGVHTMPGVTTTTGGRGGVGEETRMMTRAGPLARGIDHAEAVLGRLNKLIGRQLPEFAATQQAASAAPVAASPALRAAISDAQQGIARRLAPAGGARTDMGAVSTPAMLEELHQRKQALKQAAATPVERATIEIVALLFQSILTEERIPASVRVWFARLQMPVLRVAVSEPDFFAKDNPASRKGVSLAQQVEQRETMAIQYTIELRKMLNEVPVQEGVREFLFQVWADVLAMTAVKAGVQSEQTKAMKRAAADLIWSASAKVSREERAEVIRRLPPLLKTLRDGMEHAGLPPPKQDEHIQKLNNSLAAAFTAKAAVIPHERLEELMGRLETLEELLPDAADVEIDESMVLDLSGHESSELEVVSEGGSMPTPAMIAWARELQVGSWFMLDYRGRNEQVQLAWQGLRKQLALFVSPQGRGILFQQHRLAAFLQAGLLVPAQDESLTVRATRSALAKLDVDPSRLLN